MQKCRSVTLSKVVLLQLTSIAVKLFSKSNCQPERYKLAPSSSPTRSSFFLTATWLSYGQLRATAEWTASQTRC